MKSYTTEEKLAAAIQCLRNFQFNLHTIGYLEKVSPEENLKQFQFQLDVIKSRTDTLLAIIDPDGDVLKELLGE